MQTTGPHYRMSAGKGAALCFLALFCPPLAVSSIEGCNSTVGLNCLLTLAGWMPGMIHAWYVACKHTAEPCCTKAHHCHCAGAGGANMSHIERGEGGAVHHYHSTDGGVQVQTTVRIPAGGGVPIVDTTARHGWMQPHGQVPMLASGSMSPVNSTPTAVAQRAYEAQVPAYEQHQEYNGDLKPFTVRK